MPGSSQFRTRRSALRARASQRRIQRNERIRASQAQQALFVRRVRLIFFYLIALAAVIAGILVLTKEKLRPPARPETSPTPEEAAQP